MRLILFACFFLFSLTVKGQTVSSYLISSAGDAIMSGEGALYLSVGEPMNTELLDGDVKIAQGFLQVTVVGNILNNDELLEEHIRIFPNPAREEIRLSLEGDLTEYNFSVYDLLGNSLSSREDLSSPVIRMNNFPSGTYFIIIHKGVLSSKSMKVIKL